MVIQNHKKLYEYMRVEVTNQYSHTINNITERDANGRRVDDVNGKIIVKANDKEYVKEIESFRFIQYSIQDIVCENSVSGEVTIEFRIDNSPIPIKPFSVKAQIVEGETEV